MFIYFNWMSFEVQVHTFGLFYSEIRLTVWLTFPCALEMLISVWFVCILCMHIAYDICTALGRDLFLCIEQWRRCISHTGSIQHHSLAWCLIVPVYLVFISTLCAYTTASVQINSVKWLWQNGRVGLLYVYTISSTICTAPHPLYLHFIFHMFHTSSL